MFKLAELFVSIAADKKPFDAVINGLKGSMGTVGAAIGGAFSGAFNKALGWIGLVTTAIDKLLGMLDDGNEDVKQLGEYWTTAMLPIKAIVEGIVASINSWIGKIKALVTGSEWAKKTFNDLSIVATDMVESIKVGMDRAVSVFYRLKDSATLVLTHLGSLLEKVGTYIMNAFGSSAVATTASWGAALQTWVMDKLEFAGRLIRNWPDYWDLAALKIQEKVINIGEVMATIPANAVIIGEYIANNWVKLITDGINAVGAAFKSIGTYIGELAYAIYEFFKDPTKGVKMPEWKGILDGFKATADKFPDLIVASLSNKSREISKVLQKIELQEAVGYAAHPAKKDAAAAAAAAAAETDKFKSQSMGSADFYAKLRQGIFSDHSDIPKQHLKVAERTAKAAEETAEAVKKPKAAVMS